MSFETILVDTDSCRCLPFSSSQLHFLFQIPSFSQARLSRPLLDRVLVPLHLQRFRGPSSYYPRPAAPRVCCMWGKWKEGGR